MEMVQDSLNLARKLRPRTFSSVVGQDIPVRMLKNSLYMNKFFPVYLFSGQRGCGKTSTARVFSAAVNCEKFAAFRENPTQHDIPCLACSSCLAMQKGSHPDFIEIDAASNTGVDNVRQIIETSSYVPLQGTKKIYLIDEAHMLSKAAFNAFLKILEEPPQSVLFLLATTEIHKIPQTVLSRCFQVSFQALEKVAFADYLKTVCQQESITITDEALATIITETEGSARDALNLIEQVRCIESPVTEKTIRNVLGKISPSLIIQILQAIVQKNSSTLLATLTAQDFNAANPLATWDLFINAVKSLLWVKHGAQTVSPDFIHQRSDLQSLAEICSHNRLLAMMQLLWEQESIFLQTSRKKQFLEFLFLQLSQQTNIANLDDILRSIGDPKKLEAPVRMREESYGASEKKTLNVTPAAPAVIVTATQSAPLPDQVSRVPVPAIVETPGRSPEWLQAIAKLRINCSDSIVIALLEQADGSVQEDGTLSILLKKNTRFFTDKLDETKELWLPVLKTVFSSAVKVQFGELIQTAQAETPRQPLNLPREIQSAPPVKKPQPSQQAQQAASAPKKGLFDGESVTPNAADLPFGSLLISHFPGRMKRLKNTP